MGLNLWRMYKTMVLTAPDGNVTGNLTNSRGDRGFLDISLFILIFIMLEMTKGIVIDAFSTLREEKNDRMEDTEGVCFICGIERITFERQIDRTAFDEHIKSFHHMWNYLYFIIYLWEQDKDDDDGLEHDIRYAIEANDISWFPMNKAMQLQHVDLGRDEETVETKFYSALHNMEDRFHHAVANFSSYLGKSIERVSRILDATHTMNAPKKARGATAAQSLAHFGHGHHHHDKQSAIAAAVSTNDKHSKAHPSFRIAAGFLDSDEYIAVEIKSIAGLCLAESQLSNVCIRVITPTTEQYVLATEYHYLQSMASPAEVERMFSSMDNEDQNSVSSLQSGSSSQIISTKQALVDMERRTILLHRGSASDLTDNPFEVTFQVMLGASERNPRYVGHVVFQLLDEIKENQGNAEIAREFIFSQRHMNSQCVIQAVFHTHSG